MATISISISDELKRKMHDREEVNWSAVVRRFISTEVEKLEFLDRIASKSKLTENDAIELGRKLNASITARHKAYENRR